MPKRLGQMGVTLIELLVVMGIMVFVLAASSRLLMSMLMQFKQQTKIAETSIESLVGLEVMRRDLFSMGFGLPHFFENPGNMYYNEASKSPASSFNDEHTGVPHALLANIPAGTINKSYYMVIKSLLVTDDSAAGKYEFLDSNDNRSSFSSATEDLKDNDRIVVYYFDENNDYTLAMNTYAPNEWRPGGLGPGKGTYIPASNTQYYVPADAYNRRIIYGVSSDTDPLRFPFNRADYYITNGTAPYKSSMVVPERCAPNTGVLVKAILKNDYVDSNGGGTFDYNSDGKADEMPLLDCVADFRVVVDIDNDGDGVADMWTVAESFLDSATAADIRNKLKEIRIYILAQEGQINPDYEYPNSSVDVGEPSTVSHSFTLDTKIGPNWSHYRWKVYTLAVEPVSLNEVINE